MALKDSPNGYSGLSIILHWITAVAVITLWIIAELAEDLPKAEAREWMGIHISIAMSVYLILWFRIFWRIGIKRPAAEPQHRVLNWLATWVPVVLLAGIATMLLSGPLLIWSTGNGINVFDVFTIPSPIGESHDLHEAMEEVHEFGATLLYFGVLLHVLGAAKHLVVDRDGTVKKMLVPGNR